MFHSGFQMDYGAGSHTGKLVSYHMVKYTGQVCTSNGVYSYLLLPLLSDSNSPASPLCARPIHVLKCACVRARACQ